MPNAMVRDLRIEYESLGSADAPVILLIMGLGMQLVAWPDDFCQGLVARGFRIVRFDNRDAGLSGRIRWSGRLNLPLAIVAGSLGLPVAAPYRIDDMADDAAGLLDALGIAKAHIVGASMGGMIAQSVAGRHPRRTRSLVSIMSGTGNRSVSRPQWRALSALLARPSDARDTEAIVAHLVKLFGVIGSPGYPPDRATLREHLARSVRRSYDPAGSARQLLAIVASGDRREALRDIVAPTLVIHGAADPLMPLSAGRDTARHIAGARLQIIEGMGHDLPPGLIPMLVESIATHCHDADRSTKVGA